jgi:sterol 3beta-glucosyltransferase
VPAFAAAAARQGIPYTPLGTPLDPKQVLSAVMEIATTGSQRRGNRAMADRFLAPRLEELYAGCRDLARWADVVISHSAEPAGRIAAEAAGKPFVAVMLVPPWFPTRQAPPPGLPNLGGRPNRLLWRLVTAWGEAYASRPTFDSINAFRRRVGVAPLPGPLTSGFFPPGFSPIPRTSERGRWADLTLYPAFTSPDLNLIAVSPRFMSLPRDAPRRHHLTGWWFLDQPDWEPSPDIQAFLRSGPPPVAISFTSWAGVVPSDPEWDALMEAAREQTGRLVMEAVALAGVRAVVYEGWFGAETSIPETIFRAGEVPHAWLFPRVAAVVHHGGAGSTGAALRAGVPAVVVPEVWDQPFFAARLRRLGVAPPPLPRTALTPERLARAIRGALDTPGMGERAAALGEAIRQEDGAGTAVRLVESFMAGRSG